MKSYSRVFLVIPAYNEEKRIYSNVKKSKKYVKNIIVVSDGSRDNTEKEAKRSRAKVIAYKKNRGKGYAQRRGCAEALKMGADVIIIMDANQHQPKDIKKFLRALEDSDFVIGSRKKGTMKTTFINKIGNWGLTFGVNILSFGFSFNKWLSDTESGFRAFRAKEYKKLDLRGERYEIEAEMILEAARKNLKIEEIPITTTSKISGGGLGVGIKGGLKNGFFILKRKLFG